jgi:hypothetical protein
VQTPVFNLKFSNGVLPRRSVEIYEQDSCGVNETVQLKRFNRTPWQGTIDEFQIEDRRLHKARKRQRIY